MPPKRKQDDNPVLPPDLGFIRLPDILKLFPVGARSWDRGVAEGRYPQPVRLSARIRAWRVSDIRQLLESVAQGKAKVDELARRKR